MMQTAFVRHEHETNFTLILRNFLRISDGAIGVVLVDYEGETVDYVSDVLDPFELKVMAAHFRLILQQVEKNSFTEKLAGMPSRLNIVTSQQTFMIHALPDGYALLMLLKPDAILHTIERPLNECIRALYVEAGWSAYKHSLQWHTIQVESDRSEKPIAIFLSENRWSVVIIGRVITGLQQGEIGFRVVVENTDCECTLIRSFDEQWYSDFPIEALKITSSNSTFNVPL